MNRLTSADMDRLPHQQRQCFAQVLQALAKAQNAARSFGQPPQQFALQLEELLQLGADRTDLRWLLQSGLIAGLQEVTERTSPSRVFEPIRNFALPPEVRFVLGAGFTEDLLPWLTAILSPEPLPNWNRSLRELRLGDVLVKVYRVLADCQAIVLDTFQEEEWTERIDDPLPGVHGLDAKARRREAVRGLNRNQSNGLLRFHCDGQGTGIRWVRIAAEP